MWDVFFNILALLSGVGVFIAGMNMMSDGIKSSAGSGLKTLLGKISNNRFVGVGVGAGVTAIIQSSSATSVMAIGFVNAGVMTLAQATAIIMGGNIGTTITGVLVSLSSLPISEFMALLAFIGVMMTFFKNEKVKLIGGTLCGLGLIFVGLDLMSAAFKGEAINNFFIDIFEVVNFPVLLVFIGIIFTALIQSSSAATGVVIIMAGTGVISVYNALFIVLGSNIGTCVTAALAAIGATTNAKRTALIHVMVKTIGAVFFTILLMIVGHQLVAIFQTLLPGNAQMQIAWFHVFFNVTNTLFLLPFVKQIVKFAETVIKEKEVTQTTLRLKHVDDRLLKTPSVALMQVQKEVEYMLSLARTNMQKSFESIFTGDTTIGAEIYENEKIIDFTNSAITRFLIKLSPLVTDKEERAIGAYFHVVNDIERIGDHAENFHEIGVAMQKGVPAFSAEATEEIKQMQAKILQMFILAETALENKDTQKLAELTALENEVDGMKKQLNVNHFNRLAKGNCHVELSPYFSSTIAGLERVGDHLINVGYSILNPTGSQSQAIKEEKIKL